MSADASLPYPAWMLRVLPRSSALASLVLVGSSLFAAETGLPSHRVFVSNERSGDVSVLDGATGSEVARWPVGKRPRGIHLSPDARTLYVAVSGSPRLGPGADPERARTLKADKAADGVAVIDVGTGNVQRKLFVGSDPEEFAITSDGRALFVSNEDEAMASSWDIATGRRIFAARVSEEPEGVAIHPSVSDVYITCETQGEVFILDQNTGREHARLAVGGRPRKVAFSPDGALAYVPVEGKAEVAVIDARKRTLAGTIAIPGEGVLPMDAAVSPEGNELYVSTGRGNTVAVIDTGRREVVAAIPVGQRVWGIALTSDGRLLYTANGASNDVSVVDVKARRELKRIAVGDGPWGVAIAPAAR